MRQKVAVDWTNRKNITLPAEMADYILAVAKAHDLPVYKLVHDAVTIYARLNPIENNGHDTSTD